MCARPEKLGQGLSPQRALCTYIKCELNLYINDLELFYFYRERRRRPDETSPVEVSKFIYSFFALTIYLIYREQNYFCYVGVCQMSVLWNSTQIDIVLKLTATNYVRPRHKCCSIRFKIERLSSHFTIRALFWLRGIRARRRLFSLIRQRWNK